MLRGNWKNFDELEENLSYPELAALVEAAREQDRRNMKFQAALQGVDLDKNKSDDSAVERAKLRARARIEGKDAEELGFEERVKAAGFGIIRE